MDHYSRITIGRNTKIVLQHNLPTSLLPCNTNFQLPSLAIHSCILQYNFHVVCFPTILQYNVAIQFPPSLAIQSLATTQPRLQYNFVLQLNLDYSCNTISSQPTTQPCNTICCIAIQFPILKPSSLQYKNCIAIQSTSLAHPRQLNLDYSCNTISSQPTTQPCNTICCIAIQFPILKPSSLQYKNCIAIQSTSLAHPRPLYHNTMPLLQYKNFFHNITCAVAQNGSAQKKFCTKFFFFSFFIIIVIIIFFIYFQHLEKSLKKIIFFPYSLILK